ncbi:unnamed protein product [Rangifer tarandus platyrhynchus]|uniref:Uncharacterized protein n=2 Tax=Rangifer tarandus platyrhynchus TaxID=3082113 RepID=A0ABN8ZJF0_RANTA|nr:unnamed protein product [Rangifer tarandus platyrhynchus]
MVHFHRTRWSGGCPPRGISESLQPGTPLQPPLERRPRVPWFPSLRSPSLISTYTTLSVIGSGYWSLMEKRAPGRWGLMWATVFSSLSFQACLALETVLLKR